MLQSDAGDALHVKSGDFPSGVWCCPIITGKLLVRLDNSSNNCRCDAKGKIWLFFQSLRAKLFALLQSDIDQGEFSDCEVLLGHDR